MTKLYAFLCLLLPCTFLWGQKTYTIIRLEEAPLLDGRPDDDCWQSITPTDIPLTSTPVFGQPALPSTVRLFYTKEALYVATTFSGAAMRSDGSQRDYTGLGDWFSIGLDTWDDDQNAFVFTVTAAGVQREERVGGNTSVVAWDAVWQSAVAQQADGWSVEIRLPFTALRFPVRGNQHWGLQLSRFDRSSGTLATWNPQQPQIQDEVLQYGSLEGLVDVQQHQRVSAAVHSRVDYVRSQEPDYGDNLGRAVLGIDGRWGFHSSSTLDVALLPGSSINEGTENCFFCSDESGWDWRNNAQLPSPRQLLAEERPMFDKGEIFLEYPALKSQYTAPLVGEFTDRYNRSKIWTAAKFSTRLPGNIGLGVYSTVLGPSSIIFGNNNAPGPLVGFRTQPITGLSNYTLLTVEKALANNSWVSLTNASLWGAQPAHNNLSTLNLQLRDPTNTYQLAGNVQVNTPSGGDTVLQANSQYQFSVGKVNGAWTWELAHLKNKYLSADLLNSTDRLFAPYGEYYSSTAQIGYRDFTPRGWRQNTSSFFKLTRNRRPKAENFNFLVAEVGISALSQRFQQWNFTMSSDLHDNLRKYYFVGATLNRRVTPRAQAALSFHSDYRRRFYYQLALQAGGNLGGEQADLQSSVQLSWAITPRLRLRLDNGVSIFTRELEVLPGIPVTGYYIRQYDVRSITSNLELNWFCTSALNMYGRLGYAGTSYKKERAFQITTEGQLVPFDHPLEISPKQFDRQLELGLQWFFAPISQLRFQCSYLPNRRTLVQNGLFFFLPRQTVNTTHASLTFIYWLDRNRKAIGNRQ